MRQLKYILSLLFFFLGFFSENLEAKTIIVENEVKESFSKQNLDEQAKEIEWLGLLYLKEEIAYQNLYSYFCFSPGSLVKNFLGELFPKKVTQNFLTDFQIAKKSTSHRENDGWRKNIFYWSPDLVDSWRILFKDGDAASELVRSKPENLEKISKFISETGMEESKLISSFGNTKNPQKWIDMKIPESELDAVYDGFKNSPPAKFEAWTPEHKAQRWQNHKAGNPDADYKTWSNQYDGNIDKAIAANRGVDDFFSGMSGNVVREKSFQNISITTAEGTQTFTRRLDIVDEDAFKGIEFKEYSSGKVYRSPDIRREYALDAELLDLDALDEIEWVFKGCEPSAPLRADLESLGIKITLLP